VGPDMSLKSPIDGAEQNFFGNDFQVYSDTLVITPMIFGTVDLLKKPLGRTFEGYGFRIRICN